VCSFSDLPTQIRTLVGGTTGRTIVGPVVTDPLTGGDRPAGRDAKARLPQVLHRSRLVVRVVTGGQSGADRAATDAAIAFDVPYGGWVPEGGWAEDFPDPPGLLAVYPGFHEAPTGDPADRTARNVVDSDATLLLVPDLSVSRGCALTWKLAGEANRPRTMIDPLSPGARRQLDEFALRLPHACALNVAGPRASECEGIYDAVRSLLSDSAPVLFGSGVAR
jgi:hypothetical protein